jgi:uncharacterized protein YuzE
MKLHYYPETDSLYIELANAPGAKTQEIVEGLLVDLDVKGNVVGLDIDHASRKLDLSKVETIALPVASMAKGDKLIAGKKKLYVERRPEGDYAVRRGNSERASDILPTQKEAIRRARELNPGHSPDVERVRHTGKGKPDRWRKA